MTCRAVLVLASGLVVQACVASSSAEPSPTQPAPAEGAPPPGQPRPPGPLDPGYPIGAIDIPCTVRAEIDATVTPDAVRMRFVLMNLSPQAAQVTLKRTCPGGTVELGGLPAGFDPMHTCQAGACASPSSTTTYTIPGGRKTVVIGETTLRAQGDACNKPLPFGSTFLQANIVTEPRQWEVCRGATVHIVRDHATGKLRRAGLIDEPVPATPPAKPAVTPKPAPQPQPKPAPPRPPRTKPCPVCAFACTNGGIPSQRRDANGCRVCACEAPF